MKIISILLVTAVLAAGCIQSDQVLDDGTIIKSDGTMVKPDGTMVKPDGTMIKPDGTMEKPDETMEKPDETMKSDTGMEIKYSGTVLAGNEAPVLDFKKSDYDAAVESNKIILLYFYADWCPVCRAEVPLMYEAFNEIQSDKVIAFRVNFNDGSTDDDEKALARQYGVAYQHTKIIIEDDSFGKYPDSWNKDRYLTEINSRIS